MSVHDFEMDLDNLYYRRKRYLPEYQNLFTALNKISDDDVRQRVVLAINGELRCPRCKGIVEKRDIGVQVVDMELCDSGIMSEAEKTQDNDQGPVQFQKKRRRRKRNYPKVVKEAQHAIEPVLEQNQSRVKRQDEQQPAKVRRTNSLECAVDSFFNSNSIDLVDNSERNECLEEAIKEKMKLEWDTCDKMIDGYLPIHDAIILNEQNKLRRQLYVWNFRQVSLSTLITDNGDNPLQLAVKENSLKYIFDILLDEKHELDVIDENQNTIVHLAVMHLKEDEIQKASDVLQMLERLLNGIDLKMLSVMNDDGLTSLQIAVKNDEYRMVEKILNVLDQRLGVANAIAPCDVNASKKEFLQYYCKLCEHFEDRVQNATKSDILNARSMKSGSTALFLALELGYDGILYLLIAHLCDPNIMNFAGVDAKTYYLERGKNSSVSAALDKVCMFLRK